MTRTLFIGLDGATFTVLDPLLGALNGAQPTMPFLRYLVENGVRANLTSTPHPLTPPAWVSLMTGRTPGNHGVFDFLRAEERDGEVFFTLTDSRNVRTETIWSIASRQNRKVVALNFPMTAPPRAVNGALIPGFVPWRHLRRNVSPPELFRRLHDISGFDAEKLAWDFEREKQVMDQFSDEDIAEWVRYHLEREEQWFRISETLMTEVKPDLMAVMFDGTDKLQHQAWKFLDPALVGAQNSNSNRTLIDLCHEYFRQLDRFIERLVSLAGPEAQVFLASDHGFTASVEIVRINTILHDLGYLKWRSHLHTPQDQRRERSWFADLDWRYTTAYCSTPSNNGITIRIARKPGEPGVQPVDYHAFRDRLMAELWKFGKQYGGEPVFRRIQKREDVFPGLAMQDAPDLLVGLRDHGFMSIANLRPPIEVRREPVGTHHPVGIFIAYGGGLLKRATVDTLRIIDVAPTLLYSLGLPVPRDLEGEVPLNIFQAAARTPMRIGEPTRSPASVQTEGQDMSSEDTQKLIEQLKTLGYME